MRQYKSSRLYYRILSTLLYVAIPLVSLLLLTLLTRCVSPDLKWYQGLVRALWVASQSSIVAAAFHHRGIFEMLDLWRQTLRERRKRLGTGKKHDELHN